MCVCVCFVWVFVAGPFWTKPRFHWTVAKDVCRCWKGREERGGEGRRGEGRGGEEMGGEGRGGEERKGEEKGGRGGEGRGRGEGREGRRGQGEGRGKGGEERAGLFVLLDVVKCACGKLLHDVVALTTLSLPPPTCLPLPTLHAQLVLAVSSLANPCSWETSRLGSGETAGDSFTAPSALQSGVCVIARATCIERTGSPFES